MKQATNGRPNIERGSTEASRPNVRMKILYLITKATWGGAQRYVFDLAKNVPMNEFDPVVACGTSGKLAHDLSTAGIAVRQLPSLGRDIAILSDVKSFFEILRTIRALKPDVIHLNSSKAAALGALAARIAHVPKIIFTVHGWPFKEDRNAVSRSLIAFISWFTALLSHYVIVVSRADEVIGTHMLGIRSKMRYISLGLPPFQTRSPAEAFRAMFGPLEPAQLQSSTIRLVTIAELTKNKGLRYAIDAVSILRERNIDAIYIIAGDGEECSALQDYAKRAGVSDRIFFPGFVAHAHQNLSGFDVFVLPSIKEGMPYVLLEAIRAGLPVAATSVVDHGIATQVSNVRLVPIKDAQALADAIVELSGLPHAQEQRAGMFSLSEMVQKTVELYRLPAGRHSRVRR